MKRNAAEKPHERKYRHINDDAPVMEAYRMLRTNVEFSSSLSPLKKILITSSLVGEGKSSIVVNLARTFALGGAKTLVVDLDLRRPVIHRILEIENDAGITSCLLKKNTVPQIIKPTAFENLYAVTCGERPHNPAEQLASANLAAIIGELEGQFDIILFDSPPSAALADASIISRFTDATILVVSAGFVHYADVKNSKENLQKVGANILGIVMNNVTRHTRGYKYYSYDY